jgi:hypothetical protein
LFNSTTEIIKENDFSYINLLIKREEEEEEIVHIPERCDLN